MMNRFTLPPAARDTLAKLAAEAGPLLVRAGKGLSLLMHAGRLPTLGDTFRHLCVVGLNRSELLLAGENTPVFSDSWKNLADDNLRRGLALVFFAPRTLEGKPVNPYLFLTQEAAGDGSAEVADNLPLAEQEMAGMSLLDFCRMTPAAPNTVSMLLAADVLFHWDVHDNYVLPTTTTGWLRDVEQVMKGYPRTTRAVIYTNWDTDILPPSERIVVRPLRELALDDETWLNKPTFQQKYGNHVLALALLAATATWFGLHMQGNAIDDVNEQLRMIEQQIPSEGRFADLARAVAEQDKTMQKRDLFYLTVKDTARAVEQAGMKVASFEVKVPDPNTPPQEYVVTIEAQKGVYEGWLQEEPVARDVLTNSALMVAVRKPPGTTYKLEGLVPLAPAWKDYQALKRPLAASEEGR